MKKRRKPSRLLEISSIFSNEYNIFLRVSQARAITLPPAVFRCGDEAGIHLFPRPISAAKRIEVKAVKRAEDTIKPSLWMLLEKHALNVFFAEKIDMDHKNILYSPECCRG